MMNSSEAEEIRNVGNEICDELSVKAGKFEGEQINLSCVNSTEFTVGKQTNFNGPVTIINYGEENRLENNNTIRDAEAEEIVIKEKFAPEKSAAVVKNFPKKKSANVDKIKGFSFGETKPDLTSKLTKICMWNFFRIPIFAWCLIILFTVAVCITLGTEFSGEELPEDVETLPGETRNYTLFQRKHWGAAPEKSSVEMKLPVPYVIISSANCPPCGSLAECSAILRKQQSHQALKSESDIYPNFLVSGDGSVYEGRGWRKRNALFGFANSRSIEISFLGDFSAIAEPTANQTGAAKALIQFGLREKKLAEDYRLIPANATGISLIERELPTIGSKLYQVIKKWPRFTSNPLKDII